MPNEQHPAPREVPACRAAEQVGGGHGLVRPNHSCERACPRAGGDATVKRFHYEAHDHHEGAQDLSAWFCNSRILPTNEKRAAARAFFREVKVKSWKASWERGPTRSACPPPSPRRSLLSRGSATSAAWGSKPLKLRIALGSCFCYVFVTGRGSFGVFRRSRGRMLGLRLRSPCLTVQFAEDSE